MCVDACAQRLVEVGVVGNNALQCLIKANNGWSDERDGHSISLQYLCEKKHREMISHSLLSTIRQHYKTVFPNMYIIFMEGFPEKNKYLILEARLSAQLTNISAAMLMIVMFVCKHLSTAFIIFNIK